MPEIEITRERQAAVNDYCDSRSVLFYIAHKRMEVDPDVTPELWAAIGRINEKLSKPFDEMMGRLTKGQNGGE